MPTVYKLYAISDEDIFYVGSTIKPLRRRLSDHKSFAKTGRGTGKIHRTMRERGLEDWAIEELESVESAEELTEREQEYINSLQPPLNERSASGLNMEKRRASNRNFYHEHADERKEQHKEWVRENKDKVVRTFRQWIEDNAERYSCVCGYHTAKSDHFRAHLKRRTGVHAEVNSDTE